MLSVILRPLRRYADFSGRASRAEYWLFGLSQGAVFIFLMALAFLALTGIKENPNQAISGLLISLGLMGVVALGLFIPNLAILARRMHDINLSIWWMGLLVPSYLAQASNFMSVVRVMQASGSHASEEMMGQALMASAATSGVMGVVAALCGLALFIIVLIPGTKGPNRFGVDPKDEGGPPSSRMAFDEARIDAAIADLKAEKPHTPVFDFGPSSNDKPMIAARQAPVAQAPVHATPQAQSPAKPTFGRRR